MSDEVDNEYMTFDGAIAQLYTPGQRKQSYLEANVRRYRMTSGQASMRHPSRAI